MKLIHIKTPTIIIITPQVRVKAADLSIVKVVTDNLEGLHKEPEARDLSMVNVNIKIIDIKEAHHNKTILNTVIIINPTFREIKQVPTEAEAVAMDLSNLEDAVVVGSTIRIAMECISISITCMTHNQNNMALPAVYVVDLIIPLSIVTRENMI